MPTILQILGWRLFFYANEGNEPIHIHCKKAEIECKYWLHQDDFEISEAYGYNMNSITCVALPNEKRNQKNNISTF